MTTGLSGHDIITHHFFPISTIHSILATFFSSTTLKSFPKKGTKRKKMKNEKGKNPKKKSKIKKSNFFLNYIINCFQKFKNSISEYTG